MGIPVNDPPPPFQVCYVIIPIKEGGLSRELKRRERDHFPSSKERETARSNNEQWTELLGCYMPSWSMFLSCKEF